MRSTVMIVVLEYMAKFAKLFPALEIVQVVLAPNTSVKVI
jgi:hypothetical protein